MRERQTDVCYPVNKVVSVCMHVCVYVRRLKLINVCVYTYMVL